jgi:hypothetical protein
MAHFAKLDENNIVQKLCVVNNELLDASNEEASGVAFLTVWSGGQLTGNKPLITLIAIT